MSKIFVALFIVAVSSIAHAQETVERAELEAAKNECISDIKTVLDEIFAQFRSVQPLLDELSFEDIIKVVGPSVADLAEFSKKIETIDVSKVDPESEEFDQIIDDCKTLVTEGSDSAAYIKDFDKLIWAPGDDTTK